MVYAVCPTDVVHAPIERVWSLLTDPAGWGDFWDARVLNIEPAGPATAGQRIQLSSGPWPARFRLTFTFIQVDPASHTLDLDIRLPFGVVNDERLVCSRIDDASCRVTYGCHFTLPAGWRGVLLRRLLSRGFETGPADSLARLKRAAESPTRASD